MSEYYSGDSDKITFDRAGVLVERYIREHKDCLCRVTSKDVAQKYDVKESHHNLIRINRKLDERLPVVRPSGTKATQYEISDETGTRGSDSD